MKHLNLICIRHGESLANVDNDVYFKTPDHEILLTEKGKQQAYELSERLSTLYPDKSKNRVIHSPWTRAVDTAAPLARLTDYSLISDSVIHELVYLTSFKDMENHKNFADPDRLRFSIMWEKNGAEESFNDVYIRARLFLQDLILNRYSFEDGDNVFIVSHGVFLSALRAAIDHVPFVDENHIGNCQYFERSIRTL